MRVGRARHAQVLDATSSLALLMHRVVAIRVLQLSGSARALLAKAVAENDRRTSSLEKMVGNKVCSLRVCWTPFAPYPLPSLRV